MGKRIVSFERPDSPKARPSLDRTQAGPALPDREARQAAFERLIEPIRADLAEAKRIYEASLLATGSSTVPEEVLDREEAREAFHHDLIADMADYMRQLEGKWLRPAMVLFAADLFSSDRGKATVIAAALELIHNATLVHDDIIDESEIRRGRRAVWKRWGPSASVLMGDLLYAKAFELTSTYGDIAIQRVIAQATTRMCQGELHQLQSASDAGITEAEYLQVVGDKTACFMSACTQCGAMMAGAEGDAVNRVRQYGLDFGMAFQITDDVLDYVADPSELGKSVGNDLERGKVTLPLIHFVASSSDPGPVLAWLGAGERKAKADWQEAFRQTGSIEYSLGVAQRYIDRAKSHLDELAARGVEAAKVEHLKRLADFVVTRRF